MAKSSPGKAGAVGLVCRSDGSHRLKFDPTLRGLYFNGAMWTASTVLPTTFQSCLSGYDCAAPKPQSSRQKRGGALGLRSIGFLSFS
jgi:hypothetical protein